MIIKKLLIILIVMLSSAIAQAQDKASIKGRVTTYSGFPVEKAEVKIFHEEGVLGVAGVYGASQELYLEGSDISDKDGNYKLIDIKPGKYYIVAYFPSYGRVDIHSIYVGKDENKVLDIGIPIGYTHTLSIVEVSGIICQKSDNPLENVTVSLVNAFNLQDVAQTRTNKDGKYKFLIEQPGQYILIVTYPTYRAISKSLVLSDKGNNMNFVLEKE